MHTRPEQREHTPRFVQLAGTTIDLDAYVIRRPDGSTDTLTRRERELLRILVREQGRILSYARLGTEAWHYPECYYSITGIQSCVKHLRRKLGNTVAIQNIWNVGYRFCLAEEDNHASRRAT